jgi:1-aminocyclopropane-1-carboxylate deaminase
MSLDDAARVPLLFGPSPIHPLPRLSADLGGKVEVWARREDSGEIPAGSRVLYAHLGGQPALSACAHTPGVGG